MNERYLVVKAFGADDEVVGWNVVDSASDNQLVSNHSSEAEARERASTLEARSDAE